MDGSALCVIICILAVLVPVGIIGIVWSAQSRSRNRSGTSEGNIGIYGPVESAQQAGSGPAGSIEKRLSLAGPDAGSATNHSDNTVIAPEAGRFGAASGGKGRQSAASLARQARLDAEERLKVTKEAIDDGTRRSDRAESVPAADDRVRKAREAYLDGIPALTFLVAHDAKDVRDVLMQRLSVGEYRTDLPLTEAVYYSELGDDRITITDGDRGAIYWNMHLTLAEIPEGTGGKFELDRSRRAGGPRWVVGVSQIFRETRSALKSVDPDVNFAGDTRLSESAFDWRP